MWQVKSPDLVPPNIQPNQIPLFLQSIERNDPLEPNPKGLGYSPPAEFPLNPQTQEMIKRLNLLSFKYKNLLYNLELSSLNKNGDQQAVENDEELELDDLDDLDEDENNNDNVGVIFYSSTKSNLKIERRVGSVRRHGPQRGTIQV
jgi:hypothetical protein